VVEPLNNALYERDAMAEVFWGDSRAANGLWI